MRVKQARAQASKLALDLFRPHFREFAMRSTLHLLLGAGLAALLAACASTEPAPPASGPMGPGSMPHDCKMPMPMAMHASGVDKSMPMMKPMSCAKAADPASAASRDEHKH